jgi:hypothetical protein
MALKTLVFLPRFSLTSFCGGQQLGARRKSIEGRRIVAQVTGFDPAPSGQQPEDANGNPVPVGVSAAGRIVSGSD